MNRQDERLRRINAVLDHFEAWAVAMIARAIVAPHGYPEKAMRKFEVDLRNKATVAILELLGGDAKNP